MTTAQSGATDLIPQLQALQTQLQDMEAKAVGLGGLSREQWLWSPAPDVWSLALILDHLNVTDKGALPRIEQAIETLRNANQRSNGPFHYNIMERIFIRMLSPNPPFKSPVPPQFVPHAPSDPLKDAFQPFMNYLKQNSCLVEHANGYDLKAARVTSPISPRLKMTVGAYQEANIAHKRYHWTQVDALLIHPQFPK